MMSSMAGMSPAMMQQAMAQVQSMSPAELAAAQRQMAGMDPATLSRQAAEASKIMSAREQYAVSASNQLKAEGNKLHAAGERQQQSQQLMCCRCSHPSIACPPHPSRSHVHFGCGAHTAVCIHACACRWPASAAEITVPLIAFAGKYSDASEKYERARANLDGMTAPEAVALRQACQLNLGSCYLNTARWHDAVSVCSEVLAGAWRAEAHLAAFSAASFLPVTFQQCCCRSL
jgi:hypothetical protein